MTSTTTVDDSGGNREPSSVDDTSKGIYRRPSLIPVATEVPSGRRVTEVTRSEEVLVSLTEVKQTTLFVCFFTSL